MTFTGEDLLTLASVAAESWAAGVDRDWTAPAGTLEWTCTRTADHAVDTVLAPAFFLASRRLDDYPAYGVFNAGADVHPAVLIEAVVTAARILAGVVADADPSVPAIIWRYPTVQTGPPADFPPRGALELILHANDVCAGLGVAFDPPSDLCERLRRHTADWPAWRVAPGWAPLTMQGDPWGDLLRASGRAPG